MKVLKYRTITSWVEVHITVKKNKYFETVSEFSCSSKLLLLGLYLCGLVGFVSHSILTGPHAHHITHKPRDFQTTKALWLLCMA